MSQKSSSRIIIDEDTEDAAPVINEPASNGTTVDDKTKEEILFEYILKVSFGIAHCSFINETN